MTHRDDQVTEREVSSQFTEFCGQIRFNAIHITPQIWLYNSLNILRSSYIVALSILAPMELYICVCLSAALETIYSPSYRIRAYKTRLYNILYKTVSSHRLRKNKLYKFFERVQSNMCLYLKYKEQKEEKRTQFT